MKKDCKSPLISIVTPLYNSEKYIVKTIESVLAQTYTNFEWIIVDDCSKDNSVLIVESYKDERIKLYKNEVNSGTAKSRNKALDLVKGKYVTFLDSDDLLEPNYLASQLDFIERHGPIISAAYKRKTPNKESYFYVPEEVDYKTILKGSALSCLTTMYDYELFKDVRFPTNTKRHEDLVFWATILKEGYVCKGNPTPLATYIIHEGSRNTSKIKLVLPLYEVFRKNFKHNPIRSLYHVICFVLYSRKKYKNS